MKSFIGPAVEPPGKDMRTCHTISQIQIRCVKVPAWAPQPREETDAIQINEALVYPQRTRLTHATPQGNTPACMHVISADDGERELQVGSHVREYLPILDGRHTRPPSSPTTSRVLPCAFRIWHGRHFCHPCEHISHSSSTEIPRDWCDNYGTHNK